MTNPKAYCPEQGYMYQILCKYVNGGKTEWEHRDYAPNRESRDYLLGEYKLAYGSAFIFKVIQLPEKYWKK